MRRNPYCFHRKKLDTSSDRFWCLWHVSCCLGTGYYVYVLWYVCSRLRGNRRDEAWLHVALLLSMSLYFGVCTVCMCVLSLSLHLVLVLYKSPRRE
ncbi:hypothetical protein GGR52DRAFT_537289 [Hypoxylon sp. FL1284]|nr:hypothetical protein GGR52DRAFT_537289 [Hypoxylon sp. FL1284]